MLVVVFADAGIYLEGGTSQAVSRGAEGAERSELALDVAENLGISQVNVPTRDRPETRV
jgi:hypothetical protein